MSDNTHQATHNLDNRGDMSRLRRNIKIVKVAQIFATVAYFVTSIYHTGRPWTSRWFECSPSIYAYITILITLTASSLCQWWSFRPWGVLLASVVADFVCVALQMVSVITLLDQIDILRCFDRNRMSKLHHDQGHKWMLFERQPSREIYRLVCFFPRRTGAAPTCHVAQASFILSFVLIASYAFTITRAVNLLITMLFQPESEPNGNAPKLHHEGTASGSVENETPPFGQEETHQQLASISESEEPGSDLPDETWDSDSERSELEIGVSEPETEVTDRSSEHESESDESSWSSTDENFYLGLH